MLPERRIDWLTHNVFTFEVEQGDRLDKFLVTRLTEYSRSRLQGLIHDGFISVDGIMPGKAGMQLKAGQVVKVTIPAAEPTGLQAEQIPLEIIFENEDLMVVNKPAGMVVHPGAGHSSHTLVNAALAHAPDMAGISGEISPGVVHRLDKDTSGLILIAKNDQAHQYLQEQFKSRKVHKTYLALVDGHPPTPNGRIEASIGRDASHRKRMAVVTPTRGRQAVTEYHSREVFPEHELHRSASHHRSHAPDPPAPGFCRLPGGRRPGVWQTACHPGVDAHFFTCLAASDQIARRKDRQDLRSTTAGGT